MYMPIKDIDDPNAERYLVASSEPFSPTDISALEAALEPHRISVRLIEPLDGDEPITQVRLDRTVEGGWATGTTFNLDILAPLLRPYLRPGECCILTEVYCVDLLVEELTYYIIHQDRIDAIHHQDVLDHIKRVAFS
jgi:hypothetical protein